MDACWLADLCLLLLVRRRHVRLVLNAYNTTPTYVHTHIMQIHRKGDKKPITAVTRVSNGHNLCVCVCVRERGISCVCACVFT